MAEGMRRSRESSRGIADGIQVVTLVRVVSGIPQVLVQPENVFEAPEQGVMVVGGFGSTACLHKWGQQQSTDPIAAVTVYHDVRGLLGRVHQCELTRPDAAQVRTRLLVTTDLARKCDIRNGLSCALIFAFVQGVVAFIEG